MGARPSIYCNYPGETIDPHVGNWPIPTDGMGLLYKPCSSRHLNLPKQQEEVGEAGSPGTKRISLRRLHSSAYRSLAESLSRGIALQHPICPPRTHHIMLFKATSRAHPHQAPFSPSAQYSPQFPPNNLPMCIGALLFNIESLP